MTKAASPKKPADPAVEAELDRLPTAPIVELRKRYREVLRSDPPKAFGPDLLRRSIAHRIQEKAYGGLSGPTKRLLDQLVKAIAAKPNGRLEVPRRIKPGSELVRTWKGKTYRVVVRPDGFAYDGETYAGLSEIASLITGTNWNGPRFFGLRSKIREPPMASSSLKTLRCAIYTRKSTEHGLELEFNSLDAQREACESYIKSQASLGWKVLPQPYDDPAFSGGNLERPALQRLLKDIDAGKVDVVVVYKIDRLTRSLADFAKLVEAFDARSISFVAVTQQFNTTTSMGRLTLNVLLSFAQFERELSSERVRDKVAASRRKGKWTGGTVPLGYEARDKKLVINPTEAQTVRIIFRRYIELQSFGRLVVDLDKRGIVTKRRNTKLKKFNGGIPFTYGPLAHFLKNRIYIGETGHGGKWYPGEHKAIIDRKTFEKVQELLAAGVNKRKIKRFESGALLMGKLFDDRGNAMSPSFSSKNGVRYKFYVSSALLRGRKTEAGSVARVSAADIERALINALRQRLRIDEAVLDADIIGTYVERADLSNRAVKISTTPAAKIRSSQYSIPWQMRKPGSASIIEADGGCQPDAKLVQALIRAHAWLRDLANNRFATVETLAASVNLHPKLVRQELRYAYLAPTITQAIIDGNQPAALSLARIPKTLPLTWSEQRRALAVG